MFKRIVSAYDGSKKSLEAFDYALGLAVMCSANSAIPAELHVISVAQPPEPVEIVEMDAMIEYATQHYEDQFKGLIAKAAAKNIEVTTKIAVGHPADQVLKFAKEINADLIVVGQRGGSKVANWLLGDVSKRISSYASCSVLIVK